MKYICRVLLSLAVVAAGSAGADEPVFSTGPVIEDFGPKADVADDRLSSSSVFKVAFDVSDEANDGEINRRLESVARFLNMHVAAGVPAANIQLAVVVHGGASRDLVLASSQDATNPSAPLVAALLEAGVTIDLCGQSAAHYGIRGDELLPGVRLRLSAMTAHAQLQQRGYTLNPF